MFRTLADSRLLRLFSSAVIDQALLSATNFAVGLLLIRYTSDADYGQYVLAFNALLLITSFQGALIGGPPVSARPGRPMQGVLRCHRSHRIGPGSSRAGA